jgi:hypothetical protein
MNLVRTLAGLAALAGTAAPALAQMPARPTTTPPLVNRIFYPVPPWLKADPRPIPAPVSTTATPDRQPEVSEVRQTASVQPPLTVPDLIPVPPAPTTRVAPLPVTPAVSPRAAQPTPLPRVVPPMPVSAVPLPPVPQPQVPVTPTFRPGTPTRPTPR